MKTLLKVISFFFLAVLALPVVLFAQDSTSVVAFADHADLLKAVTVGVMSKYPVAGVIGTGLFILSELLGSSKRVASNSVYQLVSGFLKKIFTKK